MIVTCEIGCNIGYIYLMPKKHSRNKNYSINQSINQSQFLKDGDQLILPLLKMEYIDLPYPEVLQDMHLEEEYQNDMTDKGYMEGIELDLSYNDLFHRIENNGFETYSLGWPGDDYYLVTFNSDQKVFNENNCICPMNANQDTFLIFSTSTKKYMIDFEVEHIDIVLIEGMVTSRTDLYYLDYLSELQCRLSRSI